jgi:RNA-directed DNA polymerase
MMSKGIRIVRYADDILIFAKDRQQAGNYMSYATKVLEEELKLTVNQKKTKLTSVREGVEFLGFVIREKYLSVNPKRIKRFKDKVRWITRRNSGRAMEVIIRELHPTLRGWMNYYRVANIKGLTRDLMQWIRRRLRMVKMAQWKTYKKMHKEMRKKGIKGTGEKMDVKRWKNSNTHIIHQLLPNKYFENLGLIDMHKYEVGLLSNYY